MSLIRLARSVCRLRSIVVSPPHTEGRRKLVPMTHTHTLDWIEKPEKNNLTIVRIDRWWGSFKGRAWKKEGRVILVFFVDHDQIVMASVGICRVIFSKIRSQPSHPGFLPSLGLLVEKEISLWLVPIPLYNIAHEGRGGDFVPLMAMAWDEVSFPSLDNVMHV